jgi:hypothetical protein
MNVASIIAKSRIQSNTSVGQKSDALMLVDLNQVQDDIFSRLSIKDKKYAWNQFYPNPNTTIVGQNEYNLPMPTETLTGMKRLLRVDVKYTSSDDYISC